MVLTGLGTPRPPPIINPPPNPHTPSLNPLINHPDRPKPQVSRIKLFLPYMVRKRTFKKIMAHDEENACGIGDIVRIKPSRPLSKRKAFTLHEILRKDPKLSLQQVQQQQQQQQAAVATPSSS